MSFTTRLAFALALFCAAPLSAQAASVSVVGSTTCGTLDLGTSGGLPTIGNANFTLELTTGSPNGIPVLILGLPGQPVIPFLGCEYYPGVATVDFLLPNLDAGGNLSVPLPVANDPGAAGLAFVLQVLSIANITVTPDQIQFSNGLLVTIGN